MLLPVAASTSSSVSRDADPIRSATARAAADLPDPGGPTSTTTGATQVTRR
jgi:hypothetical protein